MGSAIANSIALTHAVAGGGLAVAAAVAAFALVGGVLGWCALRLMRRHCDRHESRYTHRRR